MLVDISEIEKYIIPYTYPNKKEKIDSKSLLAHAKLYGYTLYDILDDEGKFSGYGIHFHEFEKVYTNVTGIVKIPITVVSKKYMGENEVDDSNIEKVVEISPKLLEKIKMISSKTLELYILKRTLFPDDEDIKKVTKKIEFETLYQLFLKLYDICIFEGQVEFMGYRIDCVCKLKYISLENIPNIYIEVDEDGHTGYSPEKELARQKLIESFRNVMVRVKISRNSKPFERAKIIEKAAEKVRAQYKESIIQNTPNITAESFIEYVGENSNLDRELVGIFFKESNDPIFKYTHMEVGELFEYENGQQNYDRLRRSIKKFLTLNIDYKVQTLSKNRSVKLDGAISSGNKKAYKGEKKGEKKDGRANNGGQNKEILVLSRLGVYLTSLYAAKITEKIQHFRVNFARVYEKTLTFCELLRNNLIKDVPKPNEGLPLIKERINHEVRKKYTAKKVQKLKDENELLKESNLKLKKKLQKLKAENKLQKATIANQEALLDKYRERPDKSLDESLDKSLDKELPPSYDEVMSTKVPLSGLQRELPTLKDLEKYTVKELKDICKAKCIKGYSGKPKDDLIKYMFELL